VKTILLVDDEYAIVEVLAMLLADEGYQVLTASDGDRALELLKENVPDVVITDQMMPAVGGPDLFRAMLKDRALKRVPVVLMSSVMPPTATAKLPWAKVLRKPFDFSELVAWLRKRTRKNGK
jgi:DNA-binding response OmpR family regulator